MKKEKTKSNLLTKIQTFKNGLKSEEGKKALKELGKSIKDLNKEMDIFK